MIREIGVEVEIKKEELVKSIEIGVKEEITNVVNQLLTSKLEVSTRILNSKDEVVKTEIVTIEGTDYENLFKGVTNFMPSEKDIWLVIDSIRILTNDNI